MDQERLDYTDYRLTGHEPTLAERAQSVNDDHPGGVCPAQTRSRFSIALIAVVVLGGIAFAVVLYIGVRFGVGYFAEPWDKVVVGLACYGVAQVTISVVQWMRRRSTRPPTD